MLILRTFDVFLTPWSHFAAKGSPSGGSLTFSPSPNYMSHLPITMTIPKVISTTPEIRHLSAEHRNCLYPDENHLKLFPFYSESNCILELAWRDGLRACRCVPWYLRSHFPAEHLCYGAENACFKRIVDNRYSDATSRSSSCKADCDKITLEYGEAERLRLDVKESYFCSYIWKQTKGNTTTCLYAESKYERVRLSKPAYVSEDLL